MIFEISTEVSSIQALFDERSKNGGGGDSGDTIAILEFCFFLIGFYKWSFAQLKFLSMQLSILIKKYGRIWSRLLIRDT